MYQRLRDPAGHHPLYRGGTEHVHKPRSGPESSLRRQRHCPGHAHGPTHHQDPSERPLVAEGWPGGEGRGTEIRREHLPEWLHPFPCPRGIGHLHQAHDPAPLRCRGEEMAGFEGSHGEGEVSPHRWPWDRPRVHGQAGREVDGHHLGPRPGEELDGRPRQPPRWTLRPHPQDAIQYQIRPQDLLLHPG